jgi:hypothetical protein
MNYRKNAFFRWAMVAAAAFWATPAAADIVLYGDTFDRTGSLHDSAPTVRPVSDQYGANADAAWTAHSLWNTGGFYGVGTVARGVNSTDSGINASLPFTPESGCVYTFSATVCVESAGSTAYDYIAVGFTGSASGTAGFSSLNPSAWAVFHYQPSDSKPNYAMVGLDTSTFTNIGLDTGAIDVDLVLDTRADDWTAQWYVDGSLKYEAAIAEYPGSTTSRSAFAATTTRTCRAISTACNCRWSCPSLLDACAIGHGGSRLAGVCLAEAKMRQHEIGWQFNCHTNVTV